MVNFSIDYDRFRTLYLGLSLLLAACSTTYEPAAHTGPDASLAPSGGHSSVYMPPMLVSDDPKKANSSNQMSEPSTCNGLASLCTQRFDEAVYLTTHNAMSTADDNWLAPNQTYNLTRQLRDGVRALMWDVHSEDGETVLCHSLCQAGQRPLVDALRELKSFLTQEPDNVITIIFESYVAHEALTEAFQKAGLVHEIWDYDEVWPTLSTMIAQKKRLVVLSDKQPTEPALGIHYVWDLAWETHWSAQTKDDLSCASNRGDPKHDLFIFNHFLTRPIAMVELAEEINVDPFLSNRVEMCIEQSGQRPNFITVDFYEIGAAQALVNRLNME